MELIDTQEQLRDHYGVLHPLAVRKVHARLDDFCRRFIALSPFVVVASFDAEGRADASPRGDAPGFVRIVDDVTLLIPDRPGNNRVDSFGNIVSTGRVGLLFLVPGLNDALRVNGGGASPPTIRFCSWILWRVSCHAADCLFRSRRRSSIAVKP